MLLGGGGDEVLKMSTLAEDEWTEAAPLMGSAGLPPGWAALGTAWKTF